MELQSYILAQKIANVGYLSPASKDLFFKNIQLKAFAKNETLLKEGRVCHEIYFVERGYLRTFYNKEGKEINLQFTLPGNFVTDLKSLRNESASSYNMVAGAASSVWVFEKEKLLKLYEQSAEITALGKNLLELLLIEQEAHAHRFKIQTPEERYLYIEKEEPQLLQTISLTQLSSYLGISRESLSRIRKRRSL